MSRAVTKYMQQIVWSEHESYLFLLIIRWVHFLFFIQSFCCCYSFSLILFLSLSLSLSFFLFWYYCCFFFFAYLRWAKIEKSKWKIKNKSSFIWRTIKRSQQSEMAKFRIVLVASSYVLHKNCLVYSFLIFTFVMLFLSFTYSRYFFFFFFFVRRALPLQSFLLRPRLCHRVLYKWRKNNNNNNKIKEKKKKQQ
jgi:hypothetical protein